MDSDLEIIFKSFEDTAKNQYSDILKQINMFLFNANDFPWTE